MTTSTGEPGDLGRPLRRRAPRTRALNGSYFGRIEFFGGRYIISLPATVADDQDLHSGDTVEVRVENMAVTP